MQIFIKNKYSKWYFSIIKTAKARSLSKDIYTEHHHVLPQSLYPKYKSLKKYPWNGVYLTAREHFVCHRLLTKMVSGQNYYKMTLAVNCMMRISKNQKRWITNSYTFEKIKQELSEAIKEYRTNHPNTGKNTPDLVKKKISKSLKRYYETNENAFKNKTHSIATRKILSNKSINQRKNMVYKDSFKIIYPSGKEELVGCLTHWAKQHNFSIETLKDSYRQKRTLKKGPLKGFTVIKL